MDFESSFPVLTVLVFLCIFLFQLINTTKKSSTVRNSNTKLPPGPWKLPVIGNMLSMVSSDLPRQVLHNLAKKHGPLMHLQLGEISAVVVSSPRVANEIFKRDLSFADRPELLVSKIVMYNSSDIGFSPYGDYWRQMRKICTLELLSTKKVQSFSSIREQVARQVVHSIRKSPGSIFNLSEKIFTTMNTVTSIAAFGEGNKDQDELIKVIQDLGEAAGGFDVADLFPSYKFLHVLTGMKPRMEKLHNKFDNILNEVIDKHKESHKNDGNEDMEKEDLLDVLLRVKRTGDLEFPITLENIKAVVLDMFAAGTDTSSATVEWAMSELMRNPRAMEKAQAEVRQVLEGKEEVDETYFQGMNYLKLVIKETLRLHPPLPLLLPRECRETCEIDGYVMPVKTKVIINAWALGRDPEYWKDAECFVPERFENSSLDFTGRSFEYIPFGAGRRICPGRAFGLASVEFLLVNLLYHFDWGLPRGMGTTDLDMQASLGAGARRQNHLYLVATPYDSPLKACI